MTAQATKWSYVGGHFSFAVEHLVVKLSAILCIICEPAVLGMLYKITQYTVDIYHVRNHHHHTQRGKVDC